MSTEHKVLYDIVEVSLKASANETVFVLVFLAVVVPFAFLMIHFTRKLKSFRWLRQLYIVGMVVVPVGIVTGLVLQRIKTKSNVRNYCEWIANEDYETVKGIVSKIGRTCDSEITSFEVSGVVFEVDESTNTMLGTELSFLQTGLHVRVLHRDGTILRIEAG